MPFPALPLEPPFPGIRSHLGGLFEYQMRGVVRAHRSRRFLLWDEMGLGKSAQAIRALDARHVNSVVIVCPAVGRYKWRAELYRFSTTLREVHIIEKLTDAIPEFRSDDPIALIMSYECWTAIERLYTQAFEAVIIDEIHYCANEDSKRACRVLGGRIGPKVWPGLVSGADVAYGLTGTPMPGWIARVYTQIAAFAPERLRLGSTTLSFSQFQARFCNTRQTKHATTFVSNKPEMMPEFRERISGLFLRRKLLEVLPQMPPRRVHTLPLPNPGPAAFSLLARGEMDMDTALLRALAMQIDNPLTEEEIAKWEERLGDFPEEPPVEIATITRLTGMLKVPALTEIVSQDLTSGAMDSVVLICINHDVMDALEHALARFGVIRLDGTHSARERDWKVNAFQRGEHRVFLAQLQACMTSIELTRACHGIFVQMSWRPDENAQVAARLWRIGQTRPVLIRCASIAGSIDEAYVRVNARKTAGVAEAFAG